MRLIRWVPIIAFCLFCLSCGKQQPTVDPVSAEMQKKVTGSAAKVAVIGRTDWEADPGTGDFWANVKLRNSGGQGQVALRVILKSSVQYAGIHENATKPMYFDMPPGEMSKRLTGKVKPDMAARAIGVDVEVYPKAQ